MFRNTVKTTIPLAATGGFVVVVGSPFGDSGAQQFRTHPTTARVARPRGGR